MIFYRTLVNSNRKMKKVNIYALGALALMTALCACSKDALEERKEPGSVWEPASLDGEVVVKFAPYVSDILEKSSGVAATCSGVLSVDEVLDIVGGYELERVFPSDPRFADREKEAGLNLWYLVRFDDSRCSVDDVIAELSSLGEIQAAVPNRIIKRSYNPSVKAVPFTEASVQTRSSWAASNYFNDKYLPYQWNMVNNGEDDGSRYTIDRDNPAFADIADEDYFGHKFVKDADVNLVSDQTGKGAWDRCTGDPSVIVAGVIAAVNDNGTGISSIAGGTPDSPGVKIMSCQVFSGNMANSSVDLVKAIKYAADNGAVVLQCSFGYTSSEDNSQEYGQGYRTQEEWEEQCPLEKIALDYFIHNAGAPNGPIDGGIAVFASGNEYAPAAGFPGAADFCASVAATAGDATPAPYTNYSTGTTISAPGGDRDYYFEYIGLQDDGIGASSRSTVGTVLSTLPENVSPSGYGYMEGTSMACPHVSGVVALGISYAARMHRHFTSEEFRQMLYDTANGDMVNNAASGRKYYYRYLADLGLAHRTYFNMSDYKWQMGAGQVDAGALLDMIDGGAGVPMKFPNIYVAAGAEVTVNPAFYLDGDSFEVFISDTGIAAAEVLSDGNVVFKGVKAGSTSATITYDGKSQAFAVTVRNTVGTGWL